MRSRVWSLLGGAGLATTFFLPIVAAGRVDAPVLIWTNRHTLELLSCWVLLSGLAALFLALIATDPRPRREVLLLLGLATPSGMSLIAVLGRGALATQLERGPTWYLIAGAIASALVLGGAFWVRKPQALARVIRQALPIGLLLLAANVNTLRSMPVGARRGPAASGALTQRNTARGCSSIYVLLFDELAYDAVFANGEPLLNSMRSRSRASTVYHRATAPSDSTPSSVAAYLMSPSGEGAGSQGYADGPIGIARAAGLETEVVGWYVPYCENLGAYANRCRSFSMYNASTLYDGFSLLAPVATVLNIWPYRMPTGVLKRPAAVWLHKAELAAITEMASASSSAPVFRWVHFNVPHVPWLSDTGPLAVDAFQQTRERYVRQVAEVNRTLEAVMHALESQPRGRDTTVVVTADHGSRAGHAGEPLHVPLIVWSPGGTHQDVGEDVRVADVLRSVVRNACEAH